MEIKKKLRLFDIAANLSDHSFSKIPGDIEQVIGRSFDNGVRKLLLAAGEIGDTEVSYKLCSRFPGCYTTIGVHPCRARAAAASFEAYFAELEKLFARYKDKVVAVGECGLDFDRLEYSSKEEQLKVFPPHFALAEKHDLPMYLHSRNCEAEFLELVKAQIHRVRKGGVVHSFTGSETEMRELVAAGLFIGFNGCSLRTRENLEVVKATPLDRILLETDAPYCEIRRNSEGFALLGEFHYESKAKSDQKFLKKGRNEPCRTTEVLDVVAKVKGVSKDVLAEISYLNSCKLFGVDPN